MEKFQNLILSVLIIVLFVLAVFLVNKYAFSKASFVSVNSPIPASVYLDNKFKGQTPVKVKAEDATIQIKVIANANVYMPFETNVSVFPNTTTSVNIDFLENGNSSTIVYFDTSDTSETQISVISTPNLSKIKIDGQARGFSPVKTSVNAGMHSVESEFEGYKNQFVEIEAKQGLRTVVLFSLAADPNFIVEVKETPSPSPSTIQEVKQILILDTPTGFLKVRQDASSSSLEIGQVKPTETYKYIESNLDNSWHKIEFNNSFGWVSGQYSKLVEE